MACERNRQGLTGRYQSPLLSSRFLGEISFSAPATPDISLVDMANRGQSKLWGSMGLGAAGAGGAALAATGKDKKKK